MQMTYAGHGSNSKLGKGVFVSTSSKATCPDACQLKGNGCYAESAPMVWHWDKVTKGLKGRPWDEFLLQIRALRRGEFWRHNQAGDLPGLGDRVDTKALGQLVSANKGRRGFTYTHKPLSRKAEQTAVKEANANGFTINVSTDNLTQADAAMKKGLAPVVTILPAVTEGKVVMTPAGNKVLVCPEYTKGWTCQKCQLCAVSDRSYAIGFPAHGTWKKKVNLIASSTC
jgi:hypothetical protein